MKTQGCWIFADLPSFAEPIGNVTAAIGKEAVLPCTIRKLGNHKVRDTRRERGKREREKEKDIRAIRDGATNGSRGCSWQMSRHLSPTSLAIRLFLLLLPLLFFFFQRFLRVEETKDVRIFSQQDGTKLFVVELISIISK